MNIIVDCTLFTQLFVLLLLCWIVFILAYNDMTDCDEDEDGDGELIAEPQVSTLGLIPSFTRFHFCGFPEAEFVSREIPHRQVDVINTDDLHAHLLRV